MQFRPRDLDGIASGAITLAFRRWEAPRVRPGSRQRTPVGVLAYDAVDRVEGLSDAEAVAAGYASAEHALASLAARAGSLYRISVRIDGPDPRLALRELPPDDALRARLERMGGWTYEVLAAIAAHPGLRAPDLAARFGRETAPFKRDVRKLKELGLTVSLPVGYRLSPRGEAVLAIKRP